MSRHPAMPFWNVLTLGCWVLSPLSAAEIGEKTGVVPPTVVVRHPIDLDADGVPELEWVDTLRSGGSGIPAGVHWSRDWTLVPRQGVFVRVDAGAAEPFPVRWISPEVPDGGFPGEDARWMSQSVFVCSVSEVGFIPPPSGPPVTVTVGTIANQAPAREAPHHLTLRVGQGSDARYGWVAISLRDLGGGFPQAGPGNLEVRLRGFGLGQPGEPPRVGVDNRFRPVRLERVDAGVRLVLDPLALGNGVEAASALGSTNWTRIPPTETFDPTAFARFFRFAR